MKNRFLCWPLLAACYLLPAAAAEPLPLPTATDIAPKRQRLAELEVEAKALRTDADAVHAREVAACRDTFLVNHCRNQARDRRLTKVEQARRLEIEAAALERDIRRHEVAQKRAERARRQPVTGPATVSVEAGTAPARPIPSAPASGK